MSALVPAPAAVDAAAGDAPAGCAAVGPAFLKPIFGRGAATLRAVAGRLDRRASIPPRAPARRAWAASALLASLFCGLAALPVSAQEGPFAAGSEAESWGLSGEEKARFEARVVDVLCELTGDCPEDCGGGRRQLGLVRAADGALVLAAKNGQPLFTGAALDLLPWCGRAVEVDGLMVGDPETAPARVFQLQRIRAVEDDAFVKADRWTQAWAERYPDLASAPGPWFRKDPRVQALVARDGWLGLGLETDARFLEEWFP
ncbi:hypothetical protein [Albimonas pacifica]|uniref:Uncharacterized protein n=1 Tax=Albimonas pacifica TaxID=1114924 RepID=A0A1I3K8V6_9RHOB|nr:hypothetical protein [Albimonas pacifica]SFI68919.1 hypothetical protein SAMN05216258_108347 [Albimonas pacifica]